MMRRRERRGEKEWRGEGVRVERVCWRVAREGGEKIRGLVRFWGGVSWVYFGRGGGVTVIMRVFEGGEGCERGGREERSRQRGVEVLCVGGLSEGEAGGEFWAAGMVMVGGRFFRTQTEDRVAQGTVAVEENGLEVRNQFCRPDNGAKEAFERCHYGAAGFRAMR